MKSKASSTASTTTSTTTGAKSVSTATISKSNSTATTTSTTSTGSITTRASASLTNAANKQAQAIAGNGTQQTAASVAVNSQQTNTQQQQQQQSQQSQVSTIQMITQQPQQTIITTNQIQNQQHIPMITATIVSSNSNNNNQSLDTSTYGTEVDDLSDDTDSDDGDDSGLLNSSNSTHDIEIQAQLAAAGPAGVAAAAAIASAKKRKRPHTFETNPSVRKRQQTRLIRKLRATIDEYTTRVGQQAVVLITMPGKAFHNFKVFGAQPLENVIRTCKHEIMAELEHALSQQAPQQLKDDSSRHELPPLVIDGIPTPVEKMTQAQLRAFIPLMLKYSTGRGKPGWGKDSTRPPWWPESLPWANVRSDARNEDEKQKISWTTTLRQIVINCYRFHGRDDLLPSFSDSDEATKEQQRRHIGMTYKASLPKQSQHLSGIGGSRNSLSNKATIFSASPYASNFVQTINNNDGTVSLIQVDPTNAQILTLPDGTQVRAVRLQTIGADSLGGHPLTELAQGQTIELQAASTSLTGDMTGQQVTVSEASLGSEGQIIITGDDGSQNTYPMSSLVSIPASMYQQLANSNQHLSIVTADGQNVAIQNVLQTAVSETLTTDQGANSNNNRLFNQHQQQQQGTSQVSNKRDHNNLDNNNTVIFNGNTATTT